ncbi:MAG: hypothetical protein J5825_06755, partial [Lachnospiraceae bacterium]|nr:hypothetical protein [Lachnospiraceae bacterium]
ETESESESVPEKESESESVSEKESESESVSEKESESESVSEKESESESVSEKESESESVSEKESESESVSEKESESESVSEKESESESVSEKESESESVSEKESESESQTEGPKAKIVVVKLDAAGNVIPKGAEFELRDAAGKTLETLVVGEDGAASSAENYGEGTYYLQETKTIDGYVLNENVYEIIVTADTATVTVTIQGDDYVTFDTTDNVIRFINVTPVPTEFESDSQNESGSEAESKSEAGSENESKSEAESENESKSEAESENESKSEAESENESKSEAESENESKSEAESENGSGSEGESESESETLTDNLKTRIVILNLDEDGRPIPNEAEFELTDASGKVLETLKVNENGVATSADTYGEGTYYLRESKVADGYVLNNTTYELVISSDTQVIGVRVLGDSTVTIDLTSDEIRFVNIKTGGSAVTGDQPTVDNGNRQLPDTANGNKQNGSSTDQILGIFTTYRENAMFLFALGILGLFSAAALLYEKKKR